jgi:hypothetical protein
VHHWFKERKTGDNVLGDDDDDDDDNNNNNNNNDMGLFSPTL